MKPPKELLKLEIVPVVGGYAIKKDVSRLEDESVFLGRYDSLEEAQKVLSLVKVALFACEVINTRNRIHVTFDMDSAMYKLEQALFKAGCTDD